MQIRQGMCFTNLNVILERQLERQLSDGSCRQKVLDETGEQIRTVKPQSCWLRCKHMQIRQGMCFTNLNVILERQLERQLSDGSCRQKVLDETGEQIRTVKPQSCWLRCKHMQIRQGMCFTNLNVLP